MSSAFDYLSQEFARQRFLLLTIIIITCIFIFVSRLSRSKVNVMDEWELENGPSPIIKIGDTNLYASISSQRTEKDKPVYWVAPKEFLGKKVCNIFCKHGFLIFSLTVTSK